VGGKNKDRYRRTFVEKKEDGEQIGKGDPIRGRKRKKPMESSAFRSEKGHPEQRMLNLGRISGLRTLRRME